METLQYGNNLMQLQPTSNRQFTHSKSLNNWLLISPRQILLQGMLLTANFNIQNAHQHLSLNFRIKTYLKGQQRQFVQVFPQKGSIMRGQIKKFRVKFARQYKPQITDNGSMMLKVFVNLHTEWNKQYMMTNRLKGWNEIKDLPIEEYEIPIVISDEYQDIKRNIRNSVLFQSQFGKVSQDLSSLYGDEKFQIPEMDNQIGYNHARPKQKVRFTQIQPFYVRKRSTNSQKKGSRSSIQGNSPKREVYFGHAPRMVQSKLQMDSSIRRSRAESVKKEYSSRDLGVLGINSPVRDKEMFELPKPKRTPHLNNPFNNGENLFKNFSDEQIPSKQNFNPNFNRQDSQFSILKSLEPQNSQVNQYKFVEEQSNIQNRQNSKQPTIFKEYRTVDTNFGHGESESANKRSMELIVLAIIAGFFVALGSNVAILLS